MREVVDRSERKVELQDFMLDLHTRRGAGIGRGKTHWWNESAGLENSIPGYKSKWGDYLRKLDDAK